MAKVIIVVVIFTIFASSVHCQTCPRIISREEWGARQASSSNLAAVPTHVVIHHAASTDCSDQSSCSALVRSFQNMHIDTNGWDDIGYNYLIGGDGLVYEGRGWGKQGAHTVGYNAKSIGICFIGTFIDKLPNTVAINSALALIDCGIANGYIRSDYVLMGHRQGAATECPGTMLYNEITTWLHWSSNP